MRSKFKTRAASLAVLLIVTTLAIVPVTPVQAATYYGNYYAFHFSPQNYLYIRYYRPQPASQPQPAPAPQPQPAPAPVPEPQPAPQPAPAPAPQPAPQPASGSYQLSQFEQKVVDLVNAERAKAGLKPLAVDLQLAKVARLKAEDMRDNNYFGHDSPVYGSFFAMLRKFGITYRTAGENIAAGYRTPEAVVAAWMGSPGHRSNILNASFTTIGVGYARGGSYGNYWVQEFIGK
ncbi:CAP domain [Moorella glycerini]|uniref:Hemoglobin and hemoglobin-haptoglobin-binding protein 3 n=1 Tax=Neomoorella stamsii TaxID=1266720 RepID=A0A9X7P5I6_9FIRM|nr:putative hemoglobin and hemoglobin-haptoglobin-binding protein 3 precursor [Moorella stamsii]CEP66152.1 CAP domain [Moorella glycerini]